MSSVNDPAWATFCESFESAHSKQDLSAAIARVGGVMGGMDHKSWIEKEGEGVMDGFCEYMCIDVLDVE